MRRTFHRWFPGRRSVSVVISVVMALGCFTAMAESSGLPPSELSNAEQQFLLEANPMDLGADEQKQPLASVDGGKVSRSPLAKLDLARRAVAQYSLVGTFVAGRGGFAIIRHQQTGQEGTYPVGSRLTPDIGVTKVERNLVHLETSHGPTTLGCGSFHTSAALPDTKKVAIERTSRQPRSRQARSHQPTSEQTAEKAAAFERARQRLATLLDESAQQVTTAENFSARWRVVADYLKRLDREQRKELFSYAELVKDRLHFFRRKDEACSRLDQRLHVLRQHQK